MNRSLRAATDLNALRKQTRSDDTFATARPLGTLSSSSTPVVIQAAGRVSSTDPVDFLKLNVEPRTSFRSSQLTVVNRGGGLKATAFVQSPALSGRVRSDTVDIGSGRSSRSFGQIANPFDAPLTVFIRINRPSGSVNYKLRWRLVP